MTLPPWSYASTFPHLSGFDIQKLMHHITEDEVRKAIWDMDPLKAPGVDGVRAMFYQKNWGVVRTNVVEFVHFCFETQHVPINMS
ncbi:hypothetical protein GQ457_12G019120 [Hibiscus cannabinus]